MGDFHIDALLVGLLLFVVIAVVVKKIIDICDRMIKGTPEERIDKIVGIILTISFIFIVVFYLLRIIYAIGEAILGYS